MSDEALTRIYQRLGRVEDKLDEVLKLLRRADPGGRAWAEIAKDVKDAKGWNCPSCITANPVERGNCVGCGAMRPGLG